jgi:hypothetical protein
MADEMEIEEQIQELSRLISAAKMYELSRNEENRKEYEVALDKVLASEKHQEQPIEDGKELKLSMSASDWIKQQLDNYPLSKALQGRRSRRFGLGMSIPEGPFAYKSQHGPQLLTEEEEAALVFAAAGITGYALADLSYGAGQGGSMLAGMTSRVVASADSIENTSLIVINDDATYFIKRTQNLSPSERDELVKLTQAGQFVEAYRKLRVKIADKRTEIPVVPGVNFNINKWAVYARGSTYLLPVNDIGTVYINALLEAFEPEMGLFLVDERNNFLPAGIGRFAKSRGGHLWDNFKDGRVATIQGLEMSFAEASAVEMGSMLHSIGLMAQALGIGGYCNYARNEYNWFQALGFTMQNMSSTKYAGVNPFLAFFVRLMGQEFNFPFAVGLERNGEKLLTAYMPPNYPSMEAAVRAYIDYKFGANGMWRGQTNNTDWKNPQATSQAVKPPSEAAIQATIAYCDYVYKRYGRFPAYAAPFRTVIAYQATHVDVDFYDQFYKSSALTETQRERFKLHGK